jgi:hypothetical protein
MIFSFLKRIADGGRGSKVSPTSCHGESRRQTETPKKDHGIHGRNRNNTERNAGKRRKRMTTEFTEKDGKKHGTQPNPMKE